ncbi:BRCT domain protein [Candidatus Rickettsiella viridis]|uniref:BRCT domain protein n=1 Tax=Candidatus Rickettsiella viridis TaxID=676208 RepID=A0A2Z5V6V6_9COXI|nr:hypothetical protein [Candidatus Rickettsiella viridis]BBB14707.1 BRCT domain protein [Candidatus Rickettsiella viridis]
MPAPEPLKIHFISKNGKQFNYPSSGKQIIAYKEKTLPTQSSKIKLKVDSFFKNQPNRTFCIFHLSSEITEQIDSIFNIIETNIECLRYNKQLEKYDKLPELEKKLNDAGYSLDLDTSSSSANRCATDPVRRKRTLSSATLKDLPEANANKGRGLNRSATFNNLRSSSFRQRNTKSSNDFTITLDNRNPINKDLELYSNRIDHLKKELTEANNAKAAAEKENAALERQLQKAQTETEQENRTLQGQLQTEKTAKDDAVQAQQEAEKKIGILQEQLTNAERKIEELENKLEEARKKSDQEIENLKGKLARAQQETAQKVNEAEVTKAAAEKEKRILREQLQTANTDKGAAVQAQQETEGKLKQATTAKDDAMQAQQEAEIKIGTLQEQLTNAGLKIEELENELKEARKESAQEIETLKEEVTTQNTFRAKTTANAELWSRLKKSKEDLKQLESEKADVVKQMDGLNAEKEQLIREVENLEEQIKTANQAKDLAVSAQQEAEGKVKTLQEQLTKTQTDVEATNEAKNLAVNAQQTAESKISTLQETNRELQTKLEEAEQETVRAKQANAELQRRLDDVEGQTQKDKKDQATQAEVQKPQQNNQDLQLLLQPLQRKLKQHADLLIQKNSGLALEKAGMISTLSTSLELFAMNNSNREESLEKLKRQIQNSRKTLEQHRNISSRLLCYIFRSSSVFKTTSARLLSNIEKTISPFDTHQSPVEPPNVQPRHRV